MSIVEEVAVRHYVNGPWFTLALYSGQRVTIDLEIGRKLRVVDIFGPFTLRRWQFQIDTHPFVLTIYRRPR